MTNTAKDQFVTRNGKTITLKPWTYDVIAEHADDVRRFIEIWLQVINGNAGEDLSALKNIAPAIRASVQVPESLNALEGMADMANLAKAIWDYNEVSVGLGKFVLHREDMYSQLVKASAQETPEEPTP